MKNTLISIELLISIIADLLDCGYLDVEFILRLLNNWVNIDKQELINNYWNATAQIIIYDLIFQIAEKFIEENESEIKAILNVLDLDEYRSYNELYEIYTNYIDSHLWFKDEKIQALFEQSKFEV
jgi:hypothetical protein